MNDVLLKADSWFISNRLVVNASKSSFMCITTRQNTLNISNIKIKLDGQDLTQCSCTKLLGINIDKHLTFDEHIKYIATKVSSKIGLIHRLRQFPPVSGLNTVYITMIQTHFDYCITVWSLTTKKNIISSKTSKLLCQSCSGQFDYTFLSSSLIHNLGWMTIEERRFYFTSCLVYKCLNNSAPSYLSKRFTYVNESHKYSTRAAVKLYKPVSDWLEMLLLDSTALNM